MTRKGERKSNRSGTRDCPVCKNRRLLVEHHIHGREIGKDWDKGWNRAWICAACHDDIHSGKVFLEGWVTTTRGKELIHHKAGEENKYFPAAKPNLYGEKNGG